MWSETEQCVHGARRGALQEVEKESVVCLMPSEFRVEWGDAAQVKAEEESGRRRRRCSAKTICFTSVTRWRGNVGRKNREEWGLECEMYKDL